VLFIEKSYQILKALITFKLSKNQQNKKNSEKQDRCKLSKNQQNKKNSEKQDRCDEC